MMFCRSHAAEQASSVFKSEVEIYEKASVDPDVWPWRLFLLLFPLQVHILHVMRHEKFFRQFLFSTENENLPRLPCGWLILVQHQLRSAGYDSAY